MDTTAANKETEEMAKKKQEFISNQGQRGPELELEHSSLNKKEQKVLGTLNGEGKGRRPALSIWEIVEACGWMKVAGGKWRGNSWVRNSLRRLVRARLVEHAEDVGDGIYQISMVGRREVNRALGLHQTKKPAKAAAKSKSAKTETSKTKKASETSKPKRTKKASKKASETAKQTADATAAEDTATADSAEGQSEEVAAAPAAEEAVTA